MRFTQEELNKIVVEKFVESGLSLRQSQLISDHLVYADMHGIQTHGTLQMKDYIQRINEGYVNLEPNVIYTQTSNNTIYVDGDNGMGMPIVYDAMNKGIELFKQNNGIVMVGITNINHSGTMAYYLNEITKHGLVGMSMCITAALVAPFGGNKPYMGTNPFGFGAPIKDDYPFILDMATSTQAFGKILVAKSKGEQIPEGWGLDKDGKPTTDPSLVTQLTPFGGAKGYGIMLMINIMAGVMLNTQVGYDVPKYYNPEKSPNRLTHVLVLFDPKSYMNEENFLEDMAKMKHDINSQVPLEGFDKVRIPGQRSFEAYEKSLKEGIELLPVVEKYLFKKEG